MTADDARRDWQKLAAEARETPVRVLDDHGLGLIVLSEESYLRLRGENRNRLKQALARLHREVEKCGLDETETKTP